MIKHVVLKQDPEKPVPVEVLAESIKTIAHGIDGLEAEYLRKKKT